MCEALFFCPVVPLIVAMRGFFVVNSQIDDWDGKYQIRGNERRW